MTGTQQNYDYRTQDANVPTVAERVQTTAEDALQTALNRPIVSLVVAGTIGFAIGAIIYKSRQSRQTSLQRAIEIARSGTVNTVQNVRDRLRREGYSPAQIEGQAKRYLKDIIDAARSYTS